MTKMFHALMTLEFPKEHEAKQKNLTNELLIRQWHKVPTLTTSWFKVFRYDANLQKTEREVREEAIDDIKAVNSRLRIPSLEVVIQVGAVELFKGKI